MGQFLDEAPKGKFLDEAPAVKEPSLLDRFTTIPDAANRSFMQGTGYAEGANNPDKVPTYSTLYANKSDELIRSLPGFSKLDPKMRDALLSTTSQGPALVGSVVDQAMSPASILTAMVMEPAAKAVGGLIDEAGKLMPKSLTKPDPAYIESMIQDAGKNASDFGEVINRAQAADTATTNAKFTNLKNNAKTQLQVFTGELDPVTPTEVTVPRLADAATLENRDNYLSLAKDISKRFGDAYSKAIGNAKILITDLHEALSNAIEKAGLNAKPEATWSPSEKKVMAYYKSVGDNLPSSEMTITHDPLMGATSSMEQPLEIPLSKADQDIQRILQSKAGKKYTSGDHILSLIREEVMPFISEDNPGVSVVRSKFKPVLQMKNEAYNIFQPFNQSGEFDTTRGTQFFSKYVNGGLKPDEVRFINGMKTKFGPDVFKPLDDAIVTKNNMMKNLSDLNVQHQAELDGIQVAHDQTRAQTIMDAENHESLLDAMLKDSEKDAFQKALLVKTIKGGAKLVGTGALAGAGFEAGKNISELLMHHGK